MVRYIVNMNQTVKFTACFVISAYRDRIEWLPEDNADQVFVTDEFLFKIELVAKGEKKLVFCET